MTIQATDLDTTYEAKYTHSAHVESSFINRIFYDVNQRAMFVALDNGNTYGYAGVSLRTYEQFITADSKGRWYNEFKSTHDGGYIDDWTVIDAFSDMATDVNKRAAAWRYNENPPTPEEINKTTRVAFGDSITDVVDAESWKVEAVVEAPLSLTGFKSYEKALEALIVRVGPYQLKEARIFKD